MLTLPICSWIKTHFNDTKIIFLGRGYTKPVVELYQDVDQFEDWDKYKKESKQDMVGLLRKLNADVIIHVFPNKLIAAAAKRAGIPVRVGTSHRFYHWFNCTHRVNFTRKGSDLHEAQLNHKLLTPFGLTSVPSMEELIGVTERFKVPDVELPAELNAIQHYTVLHPKSQGSAVEWPVIKYLELAEELVAKGKWVLFTGTEYEGKKFRDSLPNNPSVIDTTGKLSLTQLIKVISRADNVVACSTGPLHIAGFLGVNTVGLFSPRRPIHPGRWKALGRKVNIVVFDEECPTCAQQKDCNCIAEIPVKSIQALLV